MAEGDRLVVQVLDNEGTFLGGNTLLAVDPRLGPLANNGGRTQTLLPQNLAEALDAFEAAMRAAFTQDTESLIRATVTRLVNKGALVAGLEQGRPAQLTTEQQAAVLRLTALREVPA